MEATPEKGRELISPLVARVYLDMETSRLGAIVPVAIIRRLLEGAMVWAESPAAMLLSEDDADWQNVWSWWRQARESNAPSDAIAWRDS